MRRLLFAAFLLLGGTALLAASRQVIVITLDGYPAYALRDPKIPAPALRNLIREGAWAPDGMTPVNPTVTWPNHTSMLTGVWPARHGVIYNGLPVREDGRVRVEADVPKSRLVLTPTVYDLAHERGLKTAEVDWPAAQDAPTIDFEFAEVPSAGSRVVREMIEAGQIDAAGVANFRHAPIAYRDEIWTEAALHILAHEHPNLLLFHLLTTDSVQHTYGARTLAASAALALADRQVARLVEAVRASKAASSTTFLIVSDHGFATAKRQIRPAVLKEHGITNVPVVAEGGTAFVYGNVPEDIFRGVEGISRVIPSSEFAALGYPPPGDRMGNLVLAAAGGYAFSGSSEGPVVQDLPAQASPGNHGYLNSNPDMRPIFVAWGAGIRQGMHIDDVRTIDLAPTIAHLLGFEMRGVQGRPIRGALR